MAFNRYKQHWLYQIRVIAATEQGLEVGRGCSLVPWLGLAVVETPISGSFCGERWCLILYFDQKSHESRRTKQR